MGDCVNRKLPNCIGQRSLHVAAHAKGTGDTWRTLGRTVSAMIWIGSEIGANTSTATIAGRTQSSARPAVTRVCLEVDTRTSAASCRSRGEGRIQTNGGVAITVMPLAGVMPFSKTMVAYTRWVMSNTGWVMAKFQAMVSDTFWVVAKWRHARFGFGDETLFYYARFTIHLDAMPYTQGVFPS